MVDGVHLHLDDYPATIELLRALLGGRDPDRVAEIGYQPSEHGAWVDWDALATSWLSSTERGVVDIARGCATFEAHGGPPPQLERRAAHGARRRRAGTVTATSTAQPTHPLRLIPSAAPDAITRRGTPHRTGQRGPRS